MAKKQYYDDGEEMSPEKALGQTYYEMKRDLEAFEMAVLSDALGLEAHTFGSPEYMWMQKLYNPNCIL